MRLRQHFPTFAAGLLTCLCSLSVSPPAAAGEITVPKSAADTNAVPPVAAVLEDALRQLKEQQASTFQAIELIRGHTETALQHNTAVVSNQLAQLSAAITDHSERQLRAMRSVEGRTLRVTLLILLVVALAASALLLFVARALRGLVHPPVAQASGGHALEDLAPHHSPDPDALLEPAATSAYTAALVEVEKRIAALEHKPPAAAVTPSREFASGQVAARPATPASSASKLRPAASVALALGSGEALVFLPRDHSSGAGGQANAALGRIGRLFKKSPPPS